MKHQKMKKILTICLFINLLTLTTGTVQTIDIKLMLNQHENNDQKEYSQSIKTISEIISKINQTDLSKYIKQIQSFGPHPTGSNEIDKLKTYLFNELKSFQLYVTSQSWQEQQYAGENIIATIPGSLSQKNLVIICAHYDTVAVSPGADDDGSGVAAILTMAKILRDYSFNNSIQFILFSGEEQGCYGSNAYATQIINQQKNVIGVLALDKIGYAKTKKDGRLIRHHADPASSWMIDLSENLSKQYQKQIDLEIVRLPFDASSDHRAFTHYDISGSNLVEQTLNPYYHTSEDTIDKMNMTYLEKVTKLATAVIITMAEGFSDLTSDDISISINDKKNNKHDAFLSVNIQNNHVPQQKATLSVTIEINHMFRNIPVEIQKEFYSIPCIWHFNKEIYENWDFHIGPQTFTKGLIEVKVSVHGLYQDFPVSKVAVKYGFIYPSHNLILLPY